MKTQSFKRIFLSMLLFIFLVVLAACQKDEDPDDPLPVGPVQLQTPANVTLSDDILSWNAVENATNYQVHINDIAESPFVVTALNYDLSHITFAAGTTYEIRVQAIGNVIQFLNSELSEAVIISIPAPEPLSTPQNVVKNDDSISWEAVDHAVNYLVYIENMTGSPFSVSGTSFNTAHLIFVRGTTYTIEVQAVANPASHLNSSRSDSITFSRPLLPFLSTPQNLVKTEDVLTWDAVADAIGYLVYISGLNGSPFAVDVTTYDLSEHTFAGGTYVIHVVAIGDDTEYSDSDASDSVSFTVLAKLSTPTHGLGHTANIFHIGIPPYDQGSTGYAGQIKLLFTNTATEQTWEVLVEAAYGEGSAYIYENLNLPTGNYTVTYKAVGNGTTHTDSDYHEGSVSFTYTSQQTQLQKPVLNLVEGTLSWNDVDHALSYEVYVNGELQEENTSPIDLTDLNPGQYTIKVVAVADGETYANSEAEIAYTVLNPDAMPLDVPGNLAIDEHILTWDVVDNAVKYLVVVGELRRQVETNSIDLRTLGLTVGEHQVRVQALGDAIEYSNSEMSEAVDYEAEVTQALNPITLGDIAGTPEQGHGGGHYNIVIHKSHAPYQQDAWSGWIRVEIVLSDGTVILQDYDMNDVIEIFMHKPTPETWFFDQIPEDGVYEMRVILIAESGSGYANSAPLVLSLNWQYTD